MTEPRTAAAERLRANAADRIAKLNPGQGGTAARREQNKRWARILIEQTLADAEKALAAERHATRGDLMERIKALEEAATEYLDASNQFISNPDRYVAARDRLRAALAEARREER